MASVVVPSINHHLPPDMPASNSTRLAFDKHSARSGVSHPSGRSPAPLPASKSFGSSPLKAEYRPQDGRDGMEAERHDQSHLPDALPSDARLDRTDRSESAHRVRADLPIYPGGGGGGDDGDTPIHSHGEELRDGASSDSSSRQHSPTQPDNFPVRTDVPSPQRIKIHSLSHIQSFAMDESSPLSRSRSSARRSQRDPHDAGPQYEISDMPVNDIIEMVAGLLTKITTTNDRQHEHLHRQAPPLDNSHGLNSQTISVLAFHGKNVPAITILNYLSRIHKYCPTTYEVFLSLLVYFDRMTEAVNSGPMWNMRQESSGRRSEQQSPSNAAWVSPLAQGSSGSASILQREDGPTMRHSTEAEASLRRKRAPDVDLLRHPGSPTIEHPLSPNPYDLSQFFVVDSFNIHRLVIAGVTCASKFFSDVFYTNSRYAKVGGLPLPELNHLEIHFLLLNDFRLAISLDEMEEYGTMLVEFYAREILGQMDGDRHACNNYRGTGPGQPLIS